MITIYIGTKKVSGYSSPDIIPLEIFSRSLFPVILFEHKALLDCFED